MNRPIVQSSVDVRLPLAGSRDGVFSAGGERRPYER